MGGKGKRMMCNVILLHRGGSGPREERVRTRGGIRDGESFTVEERTRIRGVKTASCCAAVS